MKETRFFHNPLRLLEIAVKICLLQMAAICVFSTICVVLSVFKLGIERCVIVSLLLIVPFVIASLNAILRDNFSAVTAVSKQMRKRNAMFENRKQNPSLFHLPDWMPAVIPVGGASLFVIVGIVLGIISESIRPVTISFITVLVTIFTSSTREIRMFKKGSFESKK